MLLIFILIMPPQLVLSAIPATNFDGLHCVNWNNSSMHFAPTTPNEVNVTILDLKKKTSDCKEISIKFLDIGREYYSFYLSDLFNLCLRLVTYPDQLKCACIAPIYKSGNKTNIDNYRPISVLQAINKIFEKLIYKRLVSFMDSRNLLSPTQHGFRANCSTETAAMQLVKYALPAFERNGYVLAIFIDYRKAFDCISHDILFEKLHRYGIRGIPLELLRSYFTNRAHYVKFNDAKSNSLPLNIGVVQGSCLGPILFSLYINDFSAYLDTCNNVLYADDTVITLYHDNLEELCTWVMISCRDCLCGVVTINSHLMFLKLNIWFSQIE